MFVCGGQGQNVGAIKNNLRREEADWSFCRIKNLFLYLHKNFCVHKQKENALLPCFLLQQTGTGPNKKQKSVKTLNFNAFLLVVHHVVKHCVH